MILTASLVTASHLQNLTHTTRIGPGVLQCHPASAAGTATLNLRAAPASLADIYHAIRTEDRS